MAYYNEDQLRRYFEKAIKRESEDQIRKLQKEIDYLYNREIKKVIEEIEIKKQVQMAKELKDVQINYQEELNQIGSGYDERLIFKRNEMSESIFQVIENKLKDYVQTDAYQKWLKNRLDIYQKKINGYQVIIHIALDDMMAKKMIEAEYNNLSYQLVHDKNILFGGFILTIFENKMEIDETLDARLNEQKEWFLNHSKLFIRR